MGTMDTSVATMLDTELKKVAYGGSRAGKSSGLVGLGTTASLTPSAFAGAWSELEEAAKELGPVSKPLTPMEKAIKEATEIMRV